MTNYTDEALNALNARADIALGIIRDLRNMRTPSIARSQIRARVIAYFDDSPTPLRDHQINDIVIDLIRHPSIRTAIRY